MVIQVASFLILLLITLFDQILTDCPAVVVPAGAYVISGCSTRTNSVCSIQCSATGIILSQICQANGFWSGPAFNCYGAGIGNGVVPGSGYGTNFGQGFIQPGFIGQTVGCPSLNAPVNGLYSGNCAPGVVGGVCTFQCRPGFTLQGNSMLSCLSTGSWSSATPTCATQTQTRWYILVRRWFG